MSAEPAAAHVETEAGKVAGLVARARAAMAAYENHDQARVDEAVTALAWSIYKPENARMLAELAVEDTGLGNVRARSSRTSARPSARCAT